ncbi:MAG: hypothetical protein AAGA18_04740 [Verrucomicrobiota bacterium]
MKNKLQCAKILALAAGVTISSITYGATFSFTYLDAAGFGFNDATPVSPIGGNNGTTLGEQRRNLLEEAGNTWGVFLDSNIEIKVQA